METIFILYKPAVPGNIGAAARAMKTMGFSKMRLIKPCDHLSDEARMLAHGSNDILEQAERFETFEQAVDDLDFIVGTTAKNRSSKQDYHNPSSLSEILRKKDTRIRKAGLLFGTEESGLPNEILLRCDAASTIPLAVSYPSLNLGQAVMLYAYELSAWNSPEFQKTDKNEISYRQLKERIQEIMSQTGIPEEMPLYTRILERLSLLGDEDLNLLHSISSRIHEKWMK